MVPINGCRVWDGFGDPAQTDGSHASVPRSVLLKSAGKVLIHWLADWVQAPLVLMPENAHNKILGH